MHVYVELAKLHSEESLSRYAYSARPDAPVLPCVPRRRRTRVWRWRE
jgi:hypothetical protein